MSNPQVPAYGHSSRGISASDVERAADALLRRGLRPTIERVRAEIGSGSPNTINPLLDEWWRNLAGRLDAGSAALQRLPDSLAQVAEALWLQALELGRERARLELNSREKAAELNARDLEVRAHVLTLRESELDARLRRCDQSLEETREQMLQLLTAVQRDQATLRARDRRIAELQAQLDANRHRIAALIVTQRKQSKRPSATKARRSPHPDRSHKPGSRAKPTKQSKPHRPKGRAPSQRPRLPG